MKQATHITATAEEIMKIGITLMIEVFFINHHFQGIPRFTPCLFIQLGTIGITSIVILGIMDMVGICTTQLVGTLITGCTCLTLFGVIRMD
jgi:hypothetical protein